MSADCQDNMLNTVAVRASYILPILKRFVGENPRKPEGWSTFPPGYNENRNHSAILSLRVDPLNWQSFIEIGEMSCGTTACCYQCSALPTELTRQLGAGHCVGSK